MRKLSQPETGGQPKTEPRRMEKAGRQDGWIWCSVERQRGRSRNRVFDEALRSREFIYRRKAGESRGEDSNEIHRRHLLLVPRRRFDPLYKGDEAGMVRHHRENERQRCRRLATRRRPSRGLSGE